MARYYTDPRRTRRASDQQIASGITLYSKGTAPEGYFSAGRSSFTNKAGTQTFNVFKPLPKAKTKTVTKYKTDPKQAKLIADLQKQLKILQNVPKYKPVDFSKEKAEYEKRISGLNERIGTIQKGYQTSLSELTASMRSEREAAEKALGLKFGKQLSAQQQSAAERLAEQQAASSAQLSELKDMYSSQLGQAALQRQTLQQSLQQQQQTSAANQLKFQETLAAQQSAAQKEFDALRGTMTQQRQQYEAGLAAERAANEQARQEQAMSFQRSLASQRGAPQVEGIRFATRGPAAQKGMRGISGTFGRKGGRLMKISALNV